MIRAQNRPPAPPRLRRLADAAGARGVAGQPAATEPGRPANRRDAAAGRRDRISRSSGSPRPGARRPRRRRRPPSRRRARPPGAGPRGSRPGGSSPEEAVKDQAPAASPPANRGEQLLAEAKALYTNANYPRRAAARQRGQGRQVRRGCPGRRDHRPDRHGRPGQGAEPLRRGPGVPPQGRQPACPRPADRGGRRRDLRRRVLRSQGPGAAPEALRRANGGEPGSGLAPPTPAQDAETLAAQKLNAEVGTKIAEARRYHEIDPDKAIAIYEQDHAGRPGLRAAARADPPDGPPPRSRHRAGQARTRPSTWSRWWTRSSARRSS